MPYVKKEQREALDAIVGEALEIYKKEERFYWDYILVKFAERFLVPRYNNYKNFLAEITESAFEMERRLPNCEIQMMPKPGTRAIPKDAILSSLDDFVEDLGCLKIDGDLNYVLFAFGFRISNRTDVSSYIKQLKDIVAYIRETILAPYEDEKIKENGDVK